MSTEEEFAAAQANEYANDEKREASFDIDSTDEKQSVHFQSNEDIAVGIIPHDDDPSENPWTFRTFLLGIGLAIFGAVLAEIFNFKPQTILINSVFMMLIAYVLGEAMANLIPSYQRFPNVPLLKYINPHPFNRKEHTAILIMAMSASAAALGTNVLAVDQLWYNEKMNAGMAVFMLFSSQLVGYGLIGLLRKNLIFPTKMFYPNILPNVTTIHALHSDKKGNKKKLQYFYYSFLAMFLWEIVPEWMFPMLIGFSIPCLAAPKSAWVSRLFGGANGNEGLGLLGICFDWNYIASTGNPMAIPLVATFNNVIGYLLCIVVFTGLYYSNVWNAQTFPFMSEELWTVDGSPYNQSLVMDADGQIDPALVTAYGLPYMSPTYVVYLVVTNMSISATMVHMYFYHWNAIKPAFAWMYPKNFWAMVTDRTFWRFWEQGEFDGRLNKDGSIPEICDDPHFKAMLKYKEVPQWWYMATFLLSAMVGLIIVYKANTNLPWWAYIVSLVLAYIFSLFLGGLVALFGFGGNQMQTIVQMIGGYIHKGYPVANMYFTMYGYNSCQQAFLMMGDLKQGHYMKLSPRSTFCAQMLGTCVGAIFNWVMVNQIVNTEGPILLSADGTSIWSGQMVQQYNTQAIAWGGLAQDLFSVGGIYQWVPLGFLLGFLAPIPFYIGHRIWPKAGFDYINTPILVWYIGYLFVGINSSILSFFIIAFVSQFYLRKYRPVFFQKYNYIIAAGLTGGTQVLVFILTFAVAGASGTAHAFPVWWGNYVMDSQGNPAYVDHCAVVG